MRRFLCAYLKCWWISPVIYFLLYGAFVILILQGKRLSSSVETMGFAVLATALLGILVASVLCFVKRRYLAGTLNVLLFLGCLVSAVYSVVYVFIATVTGKVPDGFPDHLVVPSDIDIAEPETLNAHLPDMGSDALQSSILSALMSERNPDLSIPDAIDSLVYLDHTRKAFL